MQEGQRLAGDGDLGSEESESVSSPQGEDGGEVEEMEVEASQAPRKKELTGKTRKGKGRHKRKGRTH